MVWNHRVVRRTWPDGEVTYGIHEAYYPEKGAEADSITLDPVAVDADTIEELRDTLKRMVKCLDHPVLEYDEIARPGTPAGVENNK